MKRLVRSTYSNNRRFKVVHAATEMTPKEIQDFDQRWDAKFGPDDEIRTFSPDEYLKRLEEMTNFE